MTKRIFCVSASLGLVAAMFGFASSASAEPMFLAKQYTRCTACHYSPTGGGMLTPYGRLLSHRELSTTGATATAPAAGAEDDPHGEQAFLFGALGDALGPVHLGLEMRPSHLHVGFPGGSVDQNLLMNLDLIGAVQHGGWTAYGSVGREPPAHGEDARFISYEHWLAYQRDDGLVLYDCWVTVCVRCAPPDNKPTPAERDTCIPFFVDELRLLRRARVLVCLGAFAWDGVLRALDAPSPRPKFAHAAEASVAGYTLLGSYHPSQQNTFTGKLTEPMLDAVFARARALVGAA